MPPKALFKETEQFRNLLQTHSLQEAEFYVACNVKLNIVKLNILYSTDLSLIFPLRVVHFK